MLAVDDLDCGILSQEFSTESHKHRAEQRIADTATPKRIKQMDLS